MDKKQNPQRVSSMMLTTAMMLSISISALAATGTAYSDTTESVMYGYDDESIVDDYISVEDAYAGEIANTEVEVVRSATFKVSIPKKIVLDGSRNADANDADYHVTVAADIPGNQTIHVAPSATTFEMTEAGGIKENLTATIIQEDTTWTVADDGFEALAADEGVEKTGNVSVAELSAGEWSGNFNFNISITESEDSVGE